MIPLPHPRRKYRLEALLLAHRPLWQPQPFKIDTPAWCAQLPALAAEVLAFGDDEVDTLAADNAALINLVARHVPELAELAQLTALPGQAPTAAPTPALHRACLDGIPGRKHAQIEAFAAALGDPRAPVLEWCAGKGHLGRWLAGTWSWPVASLEIDATLCAEGEVLAARARLDGRQCFIRGDALADASAHHCRDRHAVALHACGDLHATLIRHAVAAGTPALHLAPCCYHKTAADHHVPFTPSALRLNRDDLRLAVTDTATASPAERQRSRRAMAWKLAWVELRQALTGDAVYRPFPPVPDAWLRADFATFARHMAERASLALPEATDLGPFVALGHTRAARVRRLELVRLAFRRPLEVWLLMDMAVYLEGHGYEVTLSAFCPASVTPRNLLLAARAAAPTACAV